MKRGIPIAITAFVGITSRAPKFRRPYAWGGVVSIYSGAKIDEAMVRSAISLLRSGCSSRARISSSRSVRNPSSWLVLRVSE